MMIRLLLTLLACLAGVNSQNVVDVARDLGLNTFVQYLDDNGISDEWSEVGMINVFGPTDGAFETAQDAGLIPSDPNDLRDLLVYHAVSGTTNGILTTDKFQNDVLLESTYPDNFVRFNVYDNPDETIYSTMGSKVDMNQANNNASNGVVQVIVTVMIPPIYSINGRVGSNGNFSNFQRAINLAGLDTLLQGPGNFTLFVPTDAAFAKIPQDDLDNLFADEEACTKLVNYHLIGSTYFSEGIYDGLDLKTMQGDSVQFSVHIDGIPGVFINDQARIIYLDIRNDNGVIHVIDTVLVPPGALSNTTQTGTDSPPDPTTGDPGAASHYSLLSPILLLMLTVFITLLQ